jgi:hypothetical protein
MFEKTESGLQKLLTWIGLIPKVEVKEDSMRVIKKGSAMRVIFFYPGEEGTYVDHADVTLYENGIVHICSNQEETTTHLQNCEILWRFETDAEDRANKVRLLKPKAEGRPADDAAPKAETKVESFPGKGMSSKGPEQTLE